MAILDYKGLKANDKTVDDLCETIPDVRSAYMYLCNFVYRKHIYVCWCCRLVHSGKSQSTTSGEAVLMFCTRTGTRQGIETHVFRVDIQRDLANWSRAVVQGANDAALIVKEVTCREYTYSFTCF